MSNRIVTNIKQLKEKEGNSFGFFASLGTEKQENIVILNFLVFLGSIPTQGTK